jgi:transcriptional regulator with XRE-family HTH domain
LHFGVYSGVRVMEIGPRIAQIREDAGHTQSSLARAVGTSQSAISQIEAGERNPSYDMLRQIAEALGVTTPYLVGADVVDLKPEEEAHFRQYRGLPEAARRELEDYAAYLRHKHSRAQAPDRTKAGDAPRRS